MMRSSRSAERTKRKRMKKPMTSFVARPVIDLSSTCQLNTLGAHRSPTHHHPGSSPCSPFFPFSLPLTSWVHA
jgi:hypothetical protein